MSLLRTAAHAAVAARVVGGVQQRQHQRFAAQNAAAAQQAATAPAPAAAPAVAPAPQAQAPAVPSVLDQLTQLGQLRDAGVLTEEEFQAKKQQILAA